MFIFVKTTRSPASCSRPSSTGVIAWQGPHQGAQKSTTTGTSARSTCSSNVSSVTSSTGSKVSQPHGRDLPHGLEHDRLAHLRAADLPVDEDDRDLDDAEVSPERHVGRFDLEGVALRVDHVQIDRLEHDAAVALEAAGQVAHADAEQHLCVEGASAGDEAA